MTLMYLSFERSYVRTCQHGQVKCVVIILSKTRTKPPNQTAVRPFESKYWRKTTRVCRVQWYLKPPTHTSTFKHTARRISLDPPLQKKRMGGCYLLHPPALREQSQLSSPLQQQPAFSSSFFSQIATFTRRSIRRARARR